MTPVNSDGPVIRFMCTHIEGATYWFFHEASPRFGALWLSTMSGVIVYYLVQAGVLP